MVWTWITKFVPLADGIIAAAKRAANKKKEQERIEQNIKGVIENLFKKQFKDMNRDMVLLAGWKTIVAKIQAVDVVIRRWEFNTSQSLQYKNMDLTLDTVTKEHVKELLSIVKNVKDSMDNLEGEVDLTWREGGTDLRTAILNIKDGLDDISESFTDFKNDPKGQVVKIQGKCEDIQSETVEFFVFWDEFMKSLFRNAKTATTNFVAGLSPAVKQTISIVQSDYPTETWGSVLGDVLNKVKTIKSEIDEEESET